MGLQYQDCLCKNPKSRLWNWKLPMGTSWFIGACMGTASSSVLIATGGGGEIKHQSEKIPRDESLSFRELSW